MKRNLLVLGVLTAAACGSSDSHTGSGLGTFSITWELTAVNTHVSISCGSVDAVTLEVTSHPLFGGADKIDDFDCSDLAGQTAPLREGDYDVTVDLLDSNDVPLNDETQDLGTKTIIQDTDLRVGHVIFDF